MFLANSLWKFIMHGAMVLCSHNQEDINIVLPVCNMLQKLSHNSDNTVMAILIQVTRKNTEDYKLKI